MEPTPDTNAKRTHQCPLPALRVLHELHQQLHVAVHLPVQRLGAKCGFLCVLGMGATAVTTILKCGGNWQHIVQILVQGPVTPRHQSRPSPTHFPLPPRTCMSWMAHCWVCSSEHLPTVARLPADPVPGKPGSRPDQRLTVQVWSAGHNRGHWTTGSVQSVAAG